MRIVLTKGIIVGVSMVAAIIVAIAAQFTLLSAYATSLVMQRTNAPLTKHRVLFNRIPVPVMTLFIADATGQNERVLIPTHGLEYSPSYSADGQWVVFTAFSNGPGRPIAFCSRAIVTGGSSCTPSGRTGPSCDA
jgi:hypothetical protein